MRIIETVVKRPVMVLMACLAVLLLGGISLSRLSLDLLPDLSYPKLTIRTTYPGAVPEEVERIVTEKIEQAVSMVHGLRSIHSISREGLSIVVLEFAWGRDMDFASLHVREKLDQMGRTLPREAGKPVIIRLDPSAQPVMALSVSGRNLVSLKELCRDVIKRRLEQLEGVALAELAGGLEREIEVYVDRRKLETLNLSVEDIAQAVKAANIDLPGGTILKGRYRFSLRTTGSFQSIEEIEDIVVSQQTGGALVYLRDVGRVRDWFKERESITLYNGKESIGIFIQKEAGANTVQVSGLVHQVLDQLSREYPDIPVIVAYDEAQFISSAVENVLQAIVLGGILAFLTLFFFLHDLRNPVIIALVMPVSIIATFTLLYFTNVSLNLMSLGGLALGVGMLVDCSIVVLENIFRHREMGLDPEQAAVTGTRQVAMAVTASTFTTIAVFIPVIYVQGVAGQLFRDQALTVTFALLASLAASLTLLPVLSARLGNSNRTQIPVQDIQKKPLQRPRHPAGYVWYGPYRAFRWIMAIAASWLRQLFRLSKAVYSKAGHVFSTGTQPVFRVFDTILEWLTTRYERLLARAMARKLRSIAVLAAFFTASVIAALFLPMELMPGVDQGEFIIDLLLDPGTSISTVSSDVLKIESFMQTKSGTKDIFSSIGRTSHQMGTRVRHPGMNRAQIRVRLEKGVSAEALMDSVRTTVSSLTRGQVSFNTGETVLSQFLGSDQGDISIQITGDNPVILRDLSQKVAETCRAMPDLTDIRSDYEAGRPEYRISINRKRAGAHNLSVHAISRHIRGCVAGNLADQFKEFDRKIDIRVRPRLDQRSSIEAVLDSYMKTGSGPVKLRELVCVNKTLGPVELHRENQVRTISISANSRGRSLAHTIQNVEKAVADIPLTGTSAITIGGAKQEMSRSYKSLLYAAVLALVLVYMIMASQFESMLHPLVILFSVPMAATGTVWLLLITGQSLNVISLIGIVVLIGIAVNDSIVKIDFINRERKKGSPLNDAVLEAGKKRFRPIVMTSVTTIFGLVPLAVGLGQGGELQRPLAIAIIGGLFTSTILTLVLIPVIYSLIETHRKGSRV